MAVVLALVAAPAGADPVGPSDFTGDVTAPRVVAFEVMPPTIDVTTAPATVHFRAHVTDDLSGTVRSGVSVKINASSSTGPSFELTSGDARDGWWEGDLNVAKGAQPGPYELWLSAADRAGNLRFDGPDELQAQGFVGRLGVRSDGGDAAGPTVVAVRVRTPVVDVRAGAGEVEVEVDLEDPSGIDGVAAVAQSRPGTLSFTNGTLERSTGTATKGTWRGEVSLREHVPEGRWSLQIWADDVFYNQTRAGAEVPIPAGSDTGFDVQSHEDVVAPRFTSAEVDPIAIDVHDDDQTIHARVHVMDDVAGLDTSPWAGAVQLGLFDPIAHQNIWVSLELVDGDAHDGSWAGTITVPRSSATGARPLLLAARDLVGNDNAYVYVGSLGGPPTVLVYNLPIPPVLTEVVPVVSGVTVRWDAPADDGGSPITGYVVRELPGGATRSVAPTERSVTFTDLVPGTAHTFTVEAVNAAGPSSPSNARAAVALAQPPPGGFHRLAPTRLFDTRLTARPLEADETRVIPVAGLAGVPSSGARAVALNLTAVGATESTFLTAWPDGPRPTASSLNPTPDHIQANQVVVPVGADGAIRLYDLAGSVEVVADVVGWFDDGSVLGGDGFAAAQPTRALDTRSAGGPLLGGVDRTVRIVGVGGVPATATAVAVNVTATGATASTFVTAWGSGTRPVASTINPEPGTTVANLAIVPLSAAGTISLASAAGATDLIVDVVGWFDPLAPARLAPLAPSRIADSRIGLGLLWQPVQSGTIHHIQVARAGGVPNGARSALLNVTSVNTTEPTFLTLWDGVGERPTASSLNPEPGRISANLVTVPIGPDGTIAVYSNSGSTDVIVDVMGAFA